LKKPSCTAVVISLAFLFPASIKTQWHTNGFLDLSGAVVVETEDFSNNLWPHTFSLQSLDYLSVALDALPARFATETSFTFETRFYLNEAQAPAVLLTLGDANAERLYFQLRKEQGAILVAEFYEAGAAVAKLVTHKMLNAGEWLELAMVSERIATDLQAVRLYLNGERLAEKNFAITWRWPHEATLFLGGAPGQQTFSGKMDEVRLSAGTRYSGAHYARAQSLMADTHTLALWNFEHEPMPMPLTYHWREGAMGSRFSAFVAKAYHRDTIELEWQATREQGLEAYVVERRDATATGKFERCGYMPALGSTEQEQQYRFVDAPPAPGRYYYRLRVVDQNGNSGYSQEIAGSL